MRLDRWAAGAERSPRSGAFAWRRPAKCDGRSPDDRRADVDDKIAVYLQAGSSLVIVVDPQQRAVELHDAARTVRLDETSTIAHWALPQFEYPGRELFGVLRRA